MLNVHWFKCKSGDWCELKAVNLDTVTEEGVYVIGYKTASGSVGTVYVGQGDVDKRLADHRSGTNKTSKDILAYATRGTLVTTWAEVSILNRDGVEKYLANELKPLVGHSYPNAIPIAVNKPTKWF